VVLRQGFAVAGADAELKLEARNIFGVEYREYQDFGDGNLVDINSYDRGTQLQASLLAALLRSWAAIRGRGWLPKCKGRVHLGRRGW
jgi:hypothetical protein